MQVLLSGGIVLAVLAGALLGAVEQRSSLVPRLLPAALTERLRDPGLSGCTSWYLSQDGVHECLVNESRRMLAADDPAVMLLTLERFVDEHPSLDASCHLALHEVGRTWAVRERLDVRDAGQLLPATTDVRCSAGFTHGLLIGLLQDGSLDRSALADAGTVCRAQPSRMQQKMCLHGVGHAVTRAGRSDVDAALAACAGSLGQDGLECAPGVFHEYSLAANGLDGARRSGSIERRPERMCADRPLDIARACWLWMLHGFEWEQAPRTADEAARRCGDLDDPVQERACTTGSSWQWSRFVTERGQQLQACAGLPERVFPSCLQGLRGLNPRADVSYLRECDELDGRRQVLECHEWFAQVLAFSTSAAPGDDGALCSQLGSAPVQAACRRGWARGDEPLGVF